MRKGELLVLSLVAVSFAVGIRHSVILLRYFDREGEAQLVHRHQNAVDDERR